MPGPAPKPRSQRRRRNEPARGEWVDLEPLSAPAIPELDEVVDTEVPARTARVWEAWREDPVSALWTKADLAYAIDTILLHAADPISHAQEIRQRQSTLGLTPKGKRDLRWRIPGDPQREAEVIQMPDKAKRRLRAVEG